MSIDSNKTKKAVSDMLLAFGCDLEDPGLKRTPERVAKSWSELLRGYNEDPKDILKVSFPLEAYDSMVVLSDINFYSTCEHHLLPFSGVAKIGYIPDGNRVVGLSKLARLVECYSRRLQLQERMTQQILDAINVHLKPKGAGVLLQASHMCMECRGVMKPGAVMSTNALSGVFRENNSCRFEFFSTNGG